MAMQRLLYLSAALALSSLIPCQAASAGSTELISVSSDEIPGNGASFFGSISENGRVVAFCSRANNIVPGDTNGVADVFIRDRVAGTTERIASTRPAPSQTERAYVRWMSALTAASSLS